VISGDAAFDDLELNLAYMGLDDEAAFPPAPSRCHAMGLHALHRAAACPQRPYCPACREDHTGICPDLTQGL
jgi:hypothetical protein